MIPSLKHLMLCLILALGAPVLAHGQRGSQATSVFQLLPQRPGSAASSGSTVRLSFSSAVSLRTRPSTSEKALTSDEQKQERSRANLDRFSPLVEVTKTPFATESRVPVATLMGGRVRFNFSVTSIRSGNVMLGPTLSSETLHMPPQARSADLYGFGLSVPLDRHAQLEASNNLWRSIARIVRSP
jgi:hypothetical protein